MTQNTAPILPGIEHIVVLMLENRSFDNILGWLYDSKNAPPFNQVPSGQTFDGVSGKNLTNPWDKSGPQIAVQVPVGATTDPTNPYPDPGEVYADVYQQLYNVLPPPPPTPVPPNPPQPPPMSGFVNNYAAQKGSTPPNIMNGFRPATLSNLCQLAYQFITCDRWFASVPSQTFTNRSFVHAGTASGYVNNKLSLLPIFVNDTPTIYNLLESQKKSWRIYYGSHWFLCMTFLGQGQIERYMFDFGPRRMYPFEQFLDDAQKGNLPAYSFVEPNFMNSLIYGYESDMHPAAAVLKIGQASNVLYGDELIRKVYQALLTGPSQQWESTLLVITFDEHGGCYDHVAPGSATPPDNRIIQPSQDGYSGFLFNRYGVRVPAVLISPRIAQPHSVDHTIYDHTSVLRTVMDCFLGGNLQPNALGNRAAAATPINPTLGAASSDVPSLTVPAVSDGKPTEDGPLTDFQKAIVRAASRRLKQLGASDLAEAEPAFTTKLQSEAELQRVAATLPKSKTP
jgi:phospholipase C